MLIRRGLRTENRSRSSASKLARGRAGRALVFRGRFGLLMLFPEKATNAGKQMKVPAVCFVEWNQKINCSGVQVTRLFSHGSAQAGLSCTASQCKAERRNYSRPEILKFSMMRSVPIAKK